MKVGDGGKYFQLGSCSYCDKVAIITFTLKEL